MIDKVHSADLGTTVATSVMPPRYGLLVTAIWKTVMHLSIIVPVYNEEQFIIPVLEGLAFLELPVSREIIVVDDASEDRTFERLRERPNLWDHLERHPCNMGKGAAVRTGIDLARGDILAVKDADLEQSPDDLPRLLEPILAGRADAVIGTRYSDLGQRDVQYGLYYLGGRAMSVLANFLFGSSLTDVYCGYKVFRRETVHPSRLRSTGFEIEAELVSHFLRNGARVEEIPIYYNPRTFQEGKKIRGLDAVRGAWTFVICRFRL